jgi:hypothetical protein
MPDSYTAQGRQNCKSSRLPHTIKLMSIACRAAVLPFFMTFVCLFGCSGNKAANTTPAGNVSSVPGESASSAKTNIEELGLLVNIPYEADDVVWKEDTVRKRVIAVLHFSKADADTISAKAASRQAPQGVSMPSESWFPAELVAQSSVSSEDLLKGTSYAADEFFMEPYTSGRIVRIAETDYFVLQLTAK